MDNYRKFLEDKGYDVSEHWPEFKQRVIYRKYLKNEMIVKSGKSDTNIYILENGCVRYYSENDGKEYTHDILKAPSPFRSTFGIDPNEVSSVNIQALTDAEIYILKSNDMEYMNRTYPGFREMRERSTGEIMKRKVILGTKINMMSPEERYADFLKNNTELLKIIPHYILASYLGITPESLSRIRKRIFSRPDKL